MTRSDGRPLSLPQIKRRLKQTLDALRSGEPTVRMYRRVRAIVNGGPTAAGLVSVSEANARARLKATIVALEGAEPSAELLDSVELILDGWLAQDVAALHLLGRIQDDPEARRWWTGGAA